MARIRSRDTQPELALRRGLWREGVRGWRCHSRGLPGKADLAFTRWRVAVFVEGCFRHGHPDFHTPGKSGAYWDAKIERTKERDQIANEALKADGWMVLRFWESGPARTKLNRLRLRGGGARPDQKSYFALVAAQPLF